MAVSKAMVFLSGALGGLFFAISAMAQSKAYPDMLLFYSLPLVVVSVVGFGWGCLLLRRHLTVLVGERFGQSARERYERWDALSYAAFALYALCAGGVSLLYVTVFVVLPGFVAAQALLYLALSDRPARRAFFTSKPWLHVLFFLSGFAALIYQIVWQRALFVAYGLDMDTITVIVSVFMLGLGVGALAGGWLSRRFGGSLPWIFLGCELMTGLFGLFSVRIIGWVSSLTMQGSLLSVALGTYALLFVPTALMGATLPVLVDYLHGRSGNVGSSVATLYAANTLGGAVACFLTVDLLFSFWGLGAAANLAAMFNLAVGLLMVAYIRLLPEGSSPGKSLGLNS